jgi:hypothetical protein
MENTFRISFLNLFDLKMVVMVKFNQRSILLCCCDEIVNLRKFPRANIIIYVKEKLYVLGI